MQKTEPESRPTWPRVTSYSAVICATNGPTLPAFQAAPSPIRKAVARTRPMRGFYPIRVGVGCSRSQSDTRPPRGDGYRSRGGRKQMSFERLLKPSSGKADPHLHQDLVQTWECGYD